MLKLAKSVLIIASVSVLFSGVADRAIKLNLLSVCNLVNVSKNEGYKAESNSFPGKDMVGSLGSMGPIACLSDNLLRTVSFNSPAPTGTMLVKTVPNNQLKAFSVRDGE